jgi:predicted aspartyl protease
MRTERIPFSLHRDVPLIAIDVLVNEKGPFKFVLDTGASMTIASPTTAARAGVRLHNARVAKSLGIDGPEEIKIARIDTLQVGAIVAPNISVGISSLRVLNQGTHLKLQGILGYNFLRYFTISIDYADKLLSLRPNRSFPRVR